MRPISRRFWTIFAIILLTTLAVWGSLFWRHTSHAGRDLVVPQTTPNPPRDLPEVVGTIALAQDAQPIALTVNVNKNYAYAVNVGAGTVTVIAGAELLTTIDLKTGERPAMACPEAIGYGRCLNAVAVNRVTNHVYVTEWLYDVAQIISGTDVIDWVYAGPGPTGVIPLPDDDAIYALDKWMPGVTVIQEDEDRLFNPMPGCAPEAAAIDPKTGYVYIAGGSCNYVTVISSLLKIADIPVGDHPNGVAYNPNNGHVYVVNSGSTPATVSVISGTHVITPPIPVGNSHTELGVDGFWGIELDGSTDIIAAHPSGLVYVANWFSDTVSVISGTQWITDVVVGVNPNALGIDPNSGYVYVTNTGGDSVSVIDGTTMIATLPVGDYPFDLAVNPSTGYVYVANRDDDSISILATQPNRVWLPVVIDDDDGLGPAIEFTYVPPWGSDADLQGRVQRAQPSEYQIAVHIFVSGWWTKPTWDSPLTPIQQDGSWTCDITTEESDQTATRIMAFLVPNGYDPPPMAGEQALPQELIDNSVANVMAEREPALREIEFSGHTWKVKASETLIGPGPNYFSDRVEEVWVDGGGRLHLRIVHKDGKWYSAEVFTEAPLGYGTYVFRTASRVDQLDQNIVLGLFTWDDTAPEHNYREIDIEFARWGQATNDNGQYVVQPWQPPENMHRFNVILTGDDSTHGFDWRADRIVFQSLHGRRPFPGRVEDEIASWTYTGADIPPAGAGNARINLWLLNGMAPSDGTEAEVVIEEFEFIPMPAPALPQSHSHNRS